MEPLISKLVEIAPELSAIIIVIALFLRHITKQNVELGAIADRYHEREGEVIQVVKENTVAITELTIGVRSLNGKSSK